MKKIIAVFTVLMMLFLTCCSDKQTPDEKEALAKYEEWVEKLSVITLDEECEFNIAGAESAYNKLSDKQKETISDEAVVNARNTFEMMAKLKEILPDVCTKLGNIFAPNLSVSLDEFKEDYDYIVENLDKLTDAQKEEIGNVDAFVAAKEKYEACAADVQTLAQMYVDVFLELRSADGIAVTDVACVVNQKEDVMSYYFALKYTKDSAEKTVYAHSPLKTDIPRESVIYFEEHFYSEEPIKGYDAFVDGNYSVDSESVIAAAGK